MKKIKLIQNKDEKKVNQLAIKLKSIISDGFQNIEIKIQELKYRK